MTILERTSAGRPARIASDRQTEILSLIIFCGVGVLFGLLAVRAGIDLSPGFF